MGMFDWVKYECKCPRCGKMVSGFQTKDGENLLKDLEPREVKNFYTSCDGCRLWIEFTVEDMS